MSNFQLICIGIAAAILGLIPTVLILSSGYEEVAQIQNEIRQKEAAERVELDRQVRLQEEKEKRERYEKEQREKHQKRIQKEIDEANSYNPFGWLCSCFTNCFLFFIIPTFLWNLLVGNERKTNNRAVNHKYNYDGEPTIVYFLKMQKDADMYYKVGITKNTVEKRFAEALRYKHIDKILTMSIINCRNREQAEYIEGKILDKTTRYHYVPKIQFAGAATECRRSDAYDAIRKEWNKFI